MNLNTMSVRFIISITIILAATKLTTAITQPRAGCPTTCGNLTNITFPFGTSPDCYLDDTFLITCNKTFQPPQPFFQEGNLRVLSILPEVGELRILQPVSRVCFNSMGYINWGRSILWKTDIRKFPFSYRRNKFTSVGCATTALISGPNYTTGCVSDCTQAEHAVNGLCTGIGCCEARIPRGVRRLKIDLTSLRNHSSVYRFNPCSYLFVAEEGNYSFNSVDLWNLSGHDQFPIVLDWAVDDVPCSDAKRKTTSYACRSSNSECVDSTNGPGYLCKCSPGFRGNPYLYHGCEDINECNETPNICGDGSICSNSPPGNHSCSCQEGYHEDDGGVCRKKSQKSIWQIVSVGVSMSLLLLVLGSSWIYFILNKGKLMKQRQIFFQKNGGVMLSQLLSEQEGSVEKPKIFTVEDLKRATNNYDESRIIGQGGSGTVYKGVLLDNRDVAIKKSIISDQSQIGEFINELVILSKINHENVVKLIGCCLETKVPLLVYEFISNGTLSEHIHNKSRASSLSWEIRLKIAAESAGAIAHIHYAISTPIIHRDIKSTNILLDDNCTPKVSDFGVSRLVPRNQTQLSTLVQGTLGYLDPEYFHSTQLTMKSDVYSFGVVLAELLTGKEALSFDRPDEDRNLATYFVSSMKDGHLVEILDDKLEKEENIEQLKKVAILIKQCLRVKGEERPTMRDVEIELKGITNKHS